MRGILLVAWQELIFNLRRPTFIIMTLLIPALGLVALLASSLFGGELGSFFEKQFTSQKITGYVDHSGLIDPGLPGYEGKFVAYADESQARAALLAEEIGSYFVLPPDYVQSGLVLVYGTGGGFSSFVAADTDILPQFLVDQLLAGRVDPAIQVRARAPANIVPVTLDEKGEVDTGSAFNWLGDFVVPYLFSILFIMTIFTTSGFLLQGVSTEKEGRIIEILLSSISPTQLLAGKILGLGALGLGQMLFWLGSAAALLSATVAIFAMVGVIKLSLGVVILAVVYFILGYLLFATLMAVAGSMGTSMRESQQISGIFSFGAALPFVALNLVFSNPNSPILQALSYFPMTSPVMMLIRLGFGPVPAGQVAISLALLLAGLVFSLWAGAKVFRVGLLMYGKRPGLKDLARAFKQA
ncbi:MAG: ABC transporter permease [Anaerolineae bacterium]|nr:ABC transporter permease [Anaerolineae bacterium]